MVLSYMLRCVTLAHTIIAYLHSPYFGLQTVLLLNSIYFIFDTFPLTIKVVLNC